MRSLSYAILLATLIVCPLIFVCNVVHADTVPPSIISSDTTWTKANSPYKLSGPTLISSGVTLTIEAGATVNLNTYYLQVNGTLNARGTSTNPIYINSATVNAGQIKFTASSTSWNEQSGSGCIIENAIINQTVISIANCSVKIGSNTFNDNAGMMNSNTAITISGGSSTILNNQINGGVEVSGPSTITNNVITGGMGLYGGSPVVSNNQISGGSSYFWIGRSFDRDYDTIAIMQGSPVVSSNNIIGVIGFNAYEYSDNGYSVFDHALITGNIIQEGYTYYVAVDIGAGTGSVDIVSNIISNVQTGINILNTTEVSVKIQGNLIINSNATAISATGNAVIQDNTIVNSGIGITLNNAVSPTISGNNIENSNQYSIRLKGTSNNIDAANNWWGTTDTQAINQSIYDLKNDFNLGKVNFTPILNSPNPSAPPVTAAQLALTSPSPSSLTSTATAIPTATPTATPSIPEFSIMSIIILLFIATLAIGVGSKKTDLKIE